MDSFTRAKRKVAVVLDLRSSREQVAGDLESRAFRLRHCRMQTHGWDGRRGNGTEGVSDESWQSRRGIFLTGRVVSLCKEHGGGRGKAEPC
jgi:hypothetical protein